MSLKCDVHGDRWKCIQPAKYECDVKDFYCSDSWHKASLCEDHMKEWSQLAPDMFAIHYRTAVE